MAECESSCSFSVSVAVSKFGGVVVAVVVSESAGVVVVVGADIGGFVLS